jgi:hypothetical protein
VRTPTLLLASTLVLWASDQLFDASRKGNVAAVRTLLDKGVPVDATWRYGQTALFIAASRGHADVVALLLEQGANPNAKDTFYGMTALQGAAQKDSVDTVRLLLDKGATGADELLLSASGSGKTAMLKYLLARPGWKPATLARALTAAEARKHTEAAALLKEAGAKPSPVADVPAEVLAGYAGSYKGDRFDMTVTFSDGKLQVGGSGMPMTDCRMVDQTSCEPPQYAGMMTVVFTAEGMEIRQGTAVQKFTRSQEAPK